MRSTLAAIADSTAVLRMGGGSNEQQHQRHAGDIQRGHRERALGSSAGHEA